MGINHVWLYWTSSLPPFSILHVAEIACMIIKCELYLFIYVFLSRNRSLSHSKFKYLKKKKLFGPDSTWIRPYPDLSQFHKIFIMSPLIVHIRITYTTLHFFLFFFPLQYLSLANVTLKLQSSQERNLQHFLYLIWRSFGHDFDVIQTITQRINK
jgi:hypothetical protein